MRIKQVPEDFIVEEAFSRKPTGSGPYTWFTLKKRNLGTLDAFGVLSRKWNVPVSAFNCAGLKDKQAITTQICSVNGAARELSADGIKVQVLGASEEPVSLGMHESNRFTIVVRDISTAPAKKARFINYFGEQRFSKNNADVGKAIVKGDYKTACALLAESGTPVKDINELRALPKKLLRLYIHAYQSRLWNELVREHELHGEIPEELPIVGFGTDVEDELLKAQLAREGIKPRDFVLKSFPELSEEGTARKTALDIADFSISPLETDELNPGKKKMTVRFTLPPGAYATEVIRQLFEAPQE